MIHSDVFNILNEEKQKNRKIVFTNGCFDIIHSGHIKLFRESQKLGDILVVGVNTDDIITKLKGPERPIFRLKERIELLNSIRYIDFVVPFEEESPLNLIMKVKPDFLVKGGDWKPENIIGSEVVKSYGGQIKIIDFEPEISTTKIICRILENYQKEKKT